MQAGCSFWRRLQRDFKKYWGVYLLLLPALIFYIVFAYKPMAGIIIAFKDFSPGKGIWASPWTTSFGMQHFIDFFTSHYFWRLVKNTLVISTASIVFGFPAPIILALLLNELRNRKFKRVVQTVSYMPHFVSLIVVCGLVGFFTAKNGAIVQFLSFFGFEPVSLLSQPEYFVPIYVLSGIWQNVGWDSIIFLSALTGIDPCLYEAAEIDGANRWKQLLHITLPGISVTIIIMLLLKLGNLMDVGHEKIILLYNDGILDTADVISTFVYRKGLKDFQWSYSTAVNVFNSVINFCFIVIFNRVSRKWSEVSLW